MMIVELASDAAASTWEDITGLSNWQGARFSGTAERGTVDTGSGFDLLDDAGTRILPKLRRVRVTETDTTPDTVMWQGRTVGADLARGAIKTADSKFFDVTMADVHLDFRGIGFAGTQRPVEDDTDRIQYLLDTYLQGQSRDSTVIGDAYFNTASPYILAAHLYSGVQLIDWFTHIVERTGRQFFLTKDYDLFYDLNSATTYAAGISITDTAYDFNTAFPPSSDAHANEDASELYNYVRFWYKNRQLLTASRTASIAANDKFATAIVDESVTTSAQAIARVNQFFDEFAQEQTTYACYVDLPSTKVDLLSWGMTVSFRSAACGILTPTTFRVSKCSWELLTPGRWRAHLELGYPTKFGKRANPGVPPATGPLPFVPGGGFQYDVGTFVGGGVEASATLDDSAGTGSLLLVALSAEDDGQNRVLSTAGYTLQQTSLCHSGQSTLRLYSKVAAGGEQTVTSAATTGTARLVIIEIPGATLADSSEVDDGSSALTTLTADTLTTGAAGERGIVLAFFDVYFQSYNQGSVAPVDSLVEIDETYAGGRLRAFFGMIQTNSLAATYGPQVTLPFAPSINDAGNTWGSVAAVVVTDPDTDSVGVPVQGQLVIEPSYVSDGTTTTGSPTNYQYAPTSLIITVNGIDVSDSVNETDPEAGTYSFDTAPTVGAVIVVKYISTGLAI